LVLGRKTILKRVKVEIGRYLKDKEEYKHIAQVWRLELKASIKKNGCPQTRATITTVEIVYS